MVIDTSVRKVASALYAHLNTPRSLTAELLLRHGEWDQLVDLRVDPRNFLEGSIGAEAYRKDAQASDFLRKYPGVPLNRDLKAAAKKSFWESENRCFQTNTFLKILRLPALVSDDPIMPRMRQILERARKIASRILGPLPSELEGGFGPGTSFELKGATFSTLADKLHVTPCSTLECAPIFEHYFWASHWGRSRLELGLPLPRTVRGNRFTTVPKDSTKRRGICIEPLGNLFCQLGIGRYLKRRLKAVGIDVSKSTLSEDPIQLLLSRLTRDGQSFHREIAQKGSTDGTWATIDLSNASDTVALELVRDVLPPDWFDLLYACRSPRTLIDGKWVVLDKFSSMGNGFTFELETLVFLCLIAAETGLKVGSEVYAYGDDLLIPSESFRDAVAVLEAFGFEVNLSKSFHTGPFRESCGGDFFSGYNVRPVYLGKDMDSPLRWTALHNELVRRWGVTLASKRCVDAIPSEYRVGVPRKLEHLGLWNAPLKRGFPMWEDRSEFKTRRHRYKPEDGIDWIRILTVAPFHIPLDRWGGLTTTLALLGVSSQGVTPRGYLSPSLGWYSIS